MTLEFWYLLPIAMAIATIAMASGVEGATFFTPLFILALGLPTEVAIGVGLITEVFGFASGLVSYGRKGLIDYKLGAQMLMVTIPLAIVGTLLATIVPSAILKASLALGLVIIATSFFKENSASQAQGLDQAIAAEFPAERAKTHLVARNGEHFYYTVCNRKEGAAFGALGALFIGMISTGLGEINGYFFLKRCKVPSKISVATSVFVVAITAVSASIGHVISFSQAGDDTLALVASLVLFTIPGVIIGGQIGAAIASKIPQKILERLLAILFLLVAGLIAVELVTTLAVAQ